MTISQYINELETWGSDDRETYLRPLLRVLSPVSLVSLRDFERKHFETSEGDYLEFVKAQNKEILNCLELEMANIGAMARAEFGLEPLTQDTEIEIDEVAGRGGEDDC